MLGAHVDPELLAGWRPRYNVAPSWKDPRTDTWLRSFSIVTTPANGLVAAVHDRMPAVLARGELPPG